MRNRTQQRIGHIRIMFRQNVQTDMLAGNALDHAAQRAKPVDMLGIGQHRRRPRARRLAVVLMREIEEIAEACGISKAHMVEVIHRPGMGGFIDTIRGGNADADARAQCLLMPACAAFWARHYGP